MKLYGAPHLSWLLFGAVTIAALCRAYVKIDDRQARRFRITLVMFILFIDLLRHAALIIAGVYTVHCLPLHLCNLSLYICLIHPFRGGDYLSEFLYCAVMPGAVSALIFPDWLEYPAMSLLSISAFVLHILPVAYVLMLVFRGDIVPDARKLPQCALILVLLATPIYVLNTYLGTNFFYLIWPAPGSPLVFFARILGRPGYILGYVPMFLMVWLLLYAPRSIKLKYSNRKKGTQL